MQTFSALVRKDLKGYFDQPTGYIILFIFVGVLSWLFFQQALQNDEASMRPLFDILPFALAIFVPASTMRLIAEEHRDGTLETLLTQPIRGWVVLLSKFTSGLVFVSSGIVLTIGMPLLLQTAGDMDAGATAAQYLGSIFMAAAFVGIGLFTSSLTQNQIVSFILALFINMVLILIGLEFVTLALPSAVAVPLQDLSPMTHFSSIARGVLDLKDVLYFLALVLLFLSATFLAIRSKTLSRRAPIYHNLRVGVAGLVFVSLLVGWFGSTLSVRWDLTEDQIFTLSPATSGIIDQLDDLLTVNLYSSKDPPVQVALVSRDVDDFLDSLGSKSDKVRIIRKHPDEDEEIALEAELAGVPALQFNIRSQDELQVKTGWLGLSMTYADRREAIEHIPSIDGLEYRVASLAFQMIQQNRKSVGFLAGHGEKQTDVEMRFFGQLLASQYDVRRIDPPVDGGELDLSGVDVLIVAGATEEVPPEVFDALDAYLSGGGKAMVLVDTTQVDLSRLVAEPNPNGFASFAHRYGVFVHENLVLDIDSNETLPFTTRGGRIFLPYPYWVRVPAVEDKIARGVESVVLPWAASLELDNPEVEAVERFIPLLETTQFGALQFDYGDISPNPDAPPVAQDELGKRLMGVAVVGGAAGDGADGSSSFRLIVVGDSEWLIDSIVTQDSEQANLIMALNWVDWLAQEETLASIRSKVTTTRNLQFTSDTHKNLVRYGNIVGVPMLLVVVGGLLFIRRRHISKQVYGSEE